MVQLTAAIALGLAGSAVGAPTVKRQGLWCPDDQQNCNGPVPAGDGTVINSRNIWCPPDDPDCSTSMPDIDPVPLPLPLPDDDTTIANAKRTLVSLCDSNPGLCDGQSLPPVVARYVQEQPDKRQDITCMAVGCPKANNVKAEKRKTVQLPGPMDGNCMGIDCPVTGPIITLPDDNDNADAEKRSTTTTKPDDNNNIACMAVGCPKPEGLSTSVKRDVKAQEAALALRDHMSAVPKAARQAVTCMAIGMCDPVKPPVPMPTPISTSTESKRIVAPYKDASGSGPQPWIDTLQDAKAKNKRIINPELLEQIMKPVPIAGQEKNKRVPPPDVLAAIQKYGSARPVTEGRPAATEQKNKRVLPADFWENFDTVTWADAPTTKSKRVLPVDFWDNVDNTITWADAPQDMPKDKRNLPATEWETIQKPGSVKATE